MNKMYHIQGSVRK